MLTLSSRHTKSPCRQQVYTVYLPNLIRRFNRLAIILSTLLALRYYKLKRVNDSSCIQNVTSVPTYNAIAFYSSIALTVTTN